MIKTRSALACLSLLALLVTTGCSPSTPQLKQALHVSVRSSLLGPGTCVLQVTNVTAKPLRKLTVYFRNCDNNQQTYYNIAELKPSELREIGLLEAGWALAPNEEVTIAAEGFTGFRLQTYRADNGMVGIRAPWW